MDNVRRLKKGEILFKEGDVNNHIYVVQTGKIGLLHDRGGRKVEILVLGPSQVCGEQGLFGTVRHAFTAEALQETRVMEVSLDVLKAQLNSAQPGVKLIVKSLVDEAKQARTFIKSIKMEQDKAPCPQVSIPRVFSLLNLVSRHTGKKNADKPNEVIADWGILKLYASRMFNESFQRMRGVLEILTKLGYAKLNIEKNEEGEEELKNAQILDIQAVEDFAEFYQYHYFKGGRAEIIYVDPLALKVCKYLVEIGSHLEADRKGLVLIEYNQLLHELKDKFHFELKNTHLDALEKKGLFVKRSSRDDGSVFMSYEQAEFAKTLKFWSLIHEIDKWNEKGFVDMNEKEELEHSTGTACPDCKGVISAEHKFCPHCGHKLLAA